MNERETKMFFANVPRDQLRPVPQETKDLIKTASIYIGAAVDTLQKALESVKKRNALRPDRIFPSPELRDHIRGLEADIENLEKLAK